MIVLKGDLDEAAHIEQEHEKSKKGITKSLFHG